VDFQNRLSVKELTAFAAIQENHFASRMMKPNQIFLCPSLPIGEPHRVAVLKKSGEGRFPDDIAMVRRTSGQG
jgi:hypothetical protein